MLRLPVVPAAVTLPAMVSDVQYSAVTGSPATPQSRARVAAATSAVRAHCGWHVAPVVEQTFQVVRPRGDGDVWVASGRVESIESVTVDGVNASAASFDWDSVGGSARVEVTVRHGFSVPDELVALVCDLASRAQLIEPGVDQRTISGRTVVYGDPTLTAGDVQQLVPYTLPGFA